MEISEAEPLRVECEHFLHSFTNGNRPRTDGEEGLRVLKILNAAQRSLNTSGCKVELIRKNGSKNKMAHGHNTLSFAGSANDSVRDRLCGSVANKYNYSNVFIHETSFIDENVHIGSGSKIWHFSHILKNCTIGETCTIGQNVVIGPDVCIGNQCKIQNNVSVYKGVTLEDGVFCGPSMVFTNIYNPRAEIRKMDQVRSTLVKHGATLGANCTIVCGTTIGRYAFVGAGALVNKNVKDYALVVGNPARQIGWVCQCGERLTDSLECMACSKTYQKDENAGLLEKSCEK